MRREGILSLVLMCAAPVGAWTEVPPPEPVALQNEVEQLRQERELLDARVRMLLGQLDEARAAVVSARTQTDVLELRCRQLEEEVKLLRAGRPVSLPPAPPLEVGPLPKETAPKPARPEVARGKVTAVGRDGKLLQISAGSDAGLKEGQTLEVFRLPTGDGKGWSMPLYLGTVKLIRVDPQAALGQFHGAPPLDRRPRVGDDVASELSAK